MHGNKIFDLLAMSHKGQVRQREVGGFKSVSKFDVEPYKEYDMLYKCGLEFYCTVLVPQGPELELIQTTKETMARRMVHHFYSDTITQLYEVMNLIGKGENKEAMVTLLDTIKDIQGDNYERSN